MMFLKLHFFFYRYVDLPKGLRGAKMENLDGKPTIFGGFDGETHNRILYQYNISDGPNGSWTEHPNITLNKGRASPVVFQVPKYLFRGCN